MIRLLFSIFLLVLAGCSYFIRPEASTLKTPTIPLTQTEELYCPQETELQILGHFKQSDQEFSNTLRVIEATYGRLNFYDKLVLLGLYQIYIRPDSNSPYAHAQVIIVSPENSTYFAYKERVDSTSLEKDPSMPYINGLKEITKLGKNKYSLSQLANFLDTTFNGRVLVSPILSDFFQQQTKVIETDSELSKFYMKGDDVLKAFERMDRPNLSRIIQSFNKISENKQNLFFSQHLFDYSLKNQSDLKVKCNFDLALYDQSILLIDKEIPRSNVVGLKMKDHIGFIIGTQSFYQSPPQMLPGGPRGISSGQGQAVCLAENTRPDELKKMVLISHQERDPGQHLHHFFKRKKSSFKDLASLTKDLSGPRYLFLSNPLRLSYESERGSNEDLSALLKLSVPVYHALRLGNISGAALASIQNGSLFTDIRDKASLLCKKN